MTRVVAAHARAVWVMTIFWVTTTTSPSVIHADETGGTAGSLSTSSSSTPSSSLCNICGDGRVMTLPDAVVDVPFPLQQIQSQQELQGREDVVYETTCNDLQQSGVVGRISSIECPLVQPFVQDTCGCVSSLPLSTTSPDDDPGVEQPAAAEPSQPSEPYVDVFSISSSSSRNALRCRNSRDLLCRSAFLVIFLVVLERTL